MTDEYCYKCESVQPSDEMVCFGEDHHYGRGQLVCDKRGVGVTMTEPNYCPACGEELNDD